MGYIYYYLYISHIYYLYIYIIYRYIPTHIKSLFPTVSLKKRLQRQDILSSISMSLSLCTHVKWYILGCA